MRSSSSEAGFDDVPGIVARAAAQVLLQTRNLGKSRSTIRDIEADIARARRMLEVVAVPPGRQRRRDRDPLQSMLSAARTAVGLVASRAGVDLERDEAARAALAVAVERFGRQAALVSKATRELLPDVPFEWAAALAQRVGEAFWDEHTTILLPFASEVLPRAVAALEHILADRSVSLADPAAPARGEPAIALPRAALADVCRRHRVRSLALFGSALRLDFRPESDVDFLVTFEEGASLLDLARAREELEALLGRRVDLITPGSIRGPSRDRILSEAKVVYAAAG